MKTEKLIDGIGEMDPVYLDEYYSKNNKKRRGTAWKAALAAAVIAAAAISVLFALSPFSKGGDGRPDDVAPPAVSDVAKDTATGTEKRDPTPGEVILAGDVTPESALYVIDGNTPKNGQTIIYYDLQWYFENQSDPDAVYGVLIIPSTDEYVDLFKKSDDERAANYPPKIEELMGRYEDVGNKITGETDVKIKEELCAQYHELWVEIQALTDEYTKARDDDYKLFYETEYPAVIDLAVRRLEESGVEIKARVPDLRYWGGCLSYLYAELTEKEILALRYEDLGLTVCLASTATAYENPGPDVGEDGLLLPQD